MVRQPRGRRHTRGARASLAASAFGLATLLVGSITAAQDKQTAPEVSGDLSLFADPFAILQGNEFQCSIRNSGDTCAKVFNTPTGGGAFWPAGTPNQYVFNSGLQIAAIIGPDGGPWAGDTTGAFFYDTQGTQQAATPLTDVYDSTDLEDLEAWPAEALVSDADLFLPADIGRAAISEQDTWVQYWEGDPSRLTGRPHPLGIRVTQRSLQWNYPSGNESVIYFLMDLENVSNEEDFRRLNEAEFFAGEEVLPEDGYTLTEFYVASSADMDVTANAGENFSTAILPFDLAISYHGGFNGPAFEYSPQHFYPPFFTQAPGIVGIKYLRTPPGPDGEARGATFWSAFTGTPVGFGQPIGTSQLWRYLSGRLDPNQGDSSCDVPPQVVGSPTEVQRSLCAITPISHDTKFMLASGPFELAPGEIETIAVAYLVAPTLATLPDGSPTDIVVNSSDDSANPPGVPSFHPGFPGARGCSDDSATSCSDVDPVNVVRPIERAAGWVSHDGPAPATPLESPAQKLDQYAVQTATHSLLDRALVAQATFDAQFLRPMPPEPPVFHLLPGDGAVTVLWEPSPTDELGDPYHELASDVSSVLYNPNYRRFDVQAYEIWRGASPDEMELIAHFTHLDRPFVDVTCELVRPGDDIDNPAGPGFAIGETCPTDYERSANFIGFFNNGHPGGRPGKGVVRAASGGAALVDSLGAYPPPEWDDVTGFLSTPFVYRDTTVTNNFSYFYAVTAVDVNSAASGPPLQRSAPQPRSVLPRTDSPNLFDATFDVSMSGDDGVPLESPGFFDDDVDRETGIFPRAFPPTDAFSQTFAPLVPRLLPELSLGVTIDSIVPRHTGNPPDGQEFQPTASGFCEGGASAGGGRVASPFGACWEMYLSVERDGTVTGAIGTAYSPWWSSFGEPGVFSFPLFETEIAFDARALDAFGIPDGSSRATLDMVVGEAIANSAAEGPQNRRFGNYHSGARWFDGNSAEGAVNSIEDPARYRRVGHLTGVDTIFAPIAYTPSGPNDTAPWESDETQFEKQCFSRAVAFLDRAADLIFTWQGGGRISVRDVTHNADLPFSPRAGASWGFVTTDANSNGLIDWHDFNYIDGAMPIIRQVDGGFCNAAGGTVFDAGMTASPVSLERVATLEPTSTEGMDAILDLENGAALPQTGTGFGLYVNGHRFIFEMRDIPGAGTEWTLRTFRGSLRANLGTPDDPSGYALDRNPGGAFSAGLGPPRPGLVPGLQFRYVSDRRGLAVGFPELDAIHTVPDPYLLFSAYDGGGSNKQLVFVNLPPRATIRLYTLSGVLVDVVDHDDPTGGGRAPWDLRNHGGQLVASGVYFWHVVTPGGEERVGKFTIVNPHRD